MGFSDHILTTITLSYGKQSQYEVKIHGLLGKFVSHSRIIFTYWQPGHSQYLLPFTGLGSYGEEG